MISLEQRYRGCLLGLATGDAVGTTVEFSPPGQFEHVTDMIGGGPFELEPGQWTDDPSMALCLADSLIYIGGLDPFDLMKRFIRWWREGYLSSTGKCFDIGLTTRSSLARFELTGEPFGKVMDSSLAGNGSLMRLAPVPMFFANDPSLAIEKAELSSRTTHSARVCIDACRYFAGLLVGALHGAPKDELLSDHYAPVSGYWDRHPLDPLIRTIASGSFKTKEPPEIEGTGYVIRCLEAALWAFCKSDSFRDGCLLAVNLGNDADTTAAVYGQIAGAYYGEVGIPQDWRQKLTMREDIEQMADALFRICLK